MTVNRALILASCVACLIVPSAAARAPRVAQIVEGRSMAGVELVSRAPQDRAGNRVVSGALAGWGAAAGCFEGTNCTWRVTGGGRVHVALDGLDARARVVGMLSTDARGWRTAGGVGPGSTVVALRRAYGRRIVRHTACGLDGFGAPTLGYGLEGRRGDERRFTFFALSASRQRVSGVSIGRGEAQWDGACNSTAGASPAAVTGIAVAAALTARAAPQRITPAGVGAVKLGTAYTKLKAAGLVDRLGPGCEQISGLNARSATLRSPLRGLVEFAPTRARGAMIITVRGGATARGVGIGASTARIKQAFPAAVVDHETDASHGFTLVTIPKRHGGDMQFAVDAKTKRVKWIGIPYILFCD